MTPTYIKKLLANRVVVALSMTRLISSIGNGILQVIIPLYIWNLPAGWLPFPKTTLVGIVISLHGLSFTVFQPIMGALTDRFSRRKLLLQGGFILMGVCTLAYVAAGQITDLLIIRMIQGLALALIISASLTILATSTERMTRGGSIGLYDAMRMIGLGIGPIVGGFLEVNFGFEATFIAAAAFTLLAVFLVQIWVKELVNRKPQGETRPFRIVDLDLISTGVVGLFIAATMLAVNFTLVTTLENEFNIRLQQSSLGFGVALSTLTLVRILVQIPLGRLSDRIGRKPLIIGGLILMSPTTLLLGYVSSTIQLAGLMALMGLTNAAIASPAYALAADQSKVGGEARQMSFVTLGFGVGMIIGPLLAGTLSTIFFQLPFLFNAAISVLGAWIVHRYVFDKIQEDGRGKFTSGT